MSDGIDVAVQILGAGAMETGGTRIADTTGTGYRARAVPLRKAHDAGDHLRVWQ